MKEEREDEENDKDSSSTARSYHPVFSGSAIIRSHAATANKLSREKSNRSNSSISVLENDNSTTDYFNQTMEPSS